MKKTLFVFGIIISFLSLAFVGNHFPGVPDDEIKQVVPEILQSHAWPKNTADIILEQDENGLIVINNQARVFAHSLSSLKKMPVKQGKYLKMTVKYQVLQAQAGSEFKVIMNVKDKDGNNLASRSLGKEAVADKNHIFWDEKYVSLPEKAINVEVMLQFAGNPIKIYLLAMECETVAEKEKRPFYEAEKIFTNKKFTDVEINAALAERKKSFYKLRRNGNQVEFIEDDQIKALKLYKNPTYLYHNRMADMYKKVPDLIDAGFNVFLIPVYLGVPGHARTANTVWLENKKYQVEIVQKLVRRVLQYAPEAKIMLEICVSPHPGWAEKNPDEIAAHWDSRKYVMTGTRVNEITNKAPDNYSLDKKKPWTCPFWIPSYYSQKFNLDAAEAIKDVIAEFETYPESKAVVGVFFTRGTDGQWFCLFPENVQEVDGNWVSTAPEGLKNIHSLADYSKASLNFFKSFLRKKYDNDLIKLRNSWNDPKADFDNVQIPKTEDFFVDSSIVLRLTGNDYMADFIESRGKGMSTQFIAFCQAVKEGSNGRLLAGGYSAEGAVTSWPFLTQQCGKYMHAAKEVDFLASCPGGRVAHNPVTPSLANGSMRLHNMIPITELDFRSPTVGHWGPWGETIWYKTHNIKEFEQRSKRAKLWACAFGGTSHVYDMDGNWYNAPSMLAAWKENNFIQDLVKARPLGTDRAAIFYSESYWKYMALNSNRAFAHIVKGGTRLAFTRSGIDFDIYLLNDIFHPELEAPQILCFADALELTPEHANEIRKKFANSGRVIIWMWAPGIGITENISEIAGFNLERSPEADGKPVEILSSGQDPLLKNVKNLLISSWQPYKMGPVWKVQDQDAEILGFYAGTKLPAAAVKRYANHTEIFIGQAGNLSPEFIRNIASEAKAHIWIDTNDPAAQAGNLVLISAVSSGTKKINLKKNTKVKSVPTGQRYKLENDFLTCYLEYGEVLAIELE